MSEFRSQIQNQFLATVRKRHQPVEVVLDTGTCLRGVLKGFDQFSVTIGFHNKLEVIYKSAILYITALPKKKTRSRSQRAAPRPSSMNQPPRYTSESRPPYDDDRTLPSRSLDPADSHPQRHYPKPEIDEERQLRPRTATESEDEQPPGRLKAATESKLARTRTRTSTLSSEKSPVRTPPPRQFIEFPEHIDHEDPPPPKKTTRKSLT